MAQWNHNSMNHLNLTLPNFQPENSPAGNNYNNPTNLMSAPPNFPNLNQMKMGNPKCSFGSEFPHSSPSYQTSSSFRQPWEINSEVNCHGLPVPAERQREWLIMLNQRKLDQDFLNSFIQSQMVSQSQSPLTKMSRLGDLETEEAERLTSHLKVAEQMSEACQNPEGEHNPWQMKERPEFINEQITQYSTSKETNEKINKRKEKRKWIKRKKERKRKETETAKHRREELNIIIDKQRDIIRRSELQRKKHQEARREVDGFFSEIRRKQSEVKRIRQLFKSLRELRSLRARSLESRCALFSKQEDTDQFNNTLDQLDLFIKNKSADYEEEEKSSKLVMNDQPGTKSQDAIQKLWSTYTRKGSIEIN
ncbi:programmed cell death protein 7-like [Daphnia magna]|nr:programmed cell death protein 7-like [Daphnia magna]